MVIDQKLVLSGGGEEDRLLWLYGCKNSADILIQKIF